MVGLAGETGSILGIYKKYLRGGVDLEASRRFFSEELGDLLWYIAAVATSCGLDLDTIAESNLSRARARYGSHSRPYQPNNWPAPDASYPETERFPRRLVMEFTERRGRRDQLVGRMRLVNAEPDAFGGVVRQVNGKRIGFRVGDFLGDELTDNTRKSDGYRFHDAIHLGFLSVLGWSPNMRSLLGLKRRSDPETDEAEDGARAIFAEEGLAAVLSRLARERKGFLDEAGIDGEVLKIAEAATFDLEVEGTPAWLWRRAIHHGFRAMADLTENSGGYLLADLDARTLTYEKVVVRG
ncbi:nucleoside triphosphate pyrophosphohydrolase family protein [Actinacidiphila sp. ITFR-21]|uniref:nucleoside triphosphate pyrophosphohydrolase family protein n=1 Tax=Actinacidiphila sp. ITFR-21 TaxID=3075199 RepID=UPI00288B90C1|nr:pyrophosphatase [Streptomyces sp. ITFR-21]WNI17385.1 pyrophosphatase [Streptomyces sp. ITFR-21]